MSIVSSSKRHVAVTKTGGSCRDTPSFVIGGKKEWQENFVSLVLGLRKFLFNGFYSIFSVK